MRGRKRLTLWLRAIFTKQQVQAELDEEMRFHIDMETRKLLAAGVRAEEAHRRAHIAFGGVEKHKEIMADGRGMRGIERIIHDLRFANRQLRRTPGFTAAAVLTLALGIGGNTAVFSVVNGVLLRPLAFPHADRLVTIAHHTRGGDLPTLLPNSSATHVVYEEGSKSFDAMALYNASQGSISGDDHAPDWVDLVTTTRSLFEVISIPPMLGRTFTADEDRVGGPRTVVISYALWHQRFGEDSTVIGRTLQVDGTPRTIIGVMPSRFAFPGPATQLWLPMRVDRSNLSGFHDAGIARLRDGVTPQAAAAELTTLLPRVSTIVDFIPLSVLRDAQIRTDVHPYLDDVVGGVRPVLWMLWSMIGLVLLIACVNVASLVSVRSEARRQEFAVRIALGAERHHLLFQSLAESSMLLLLGGVLGTLLAWFALSILPQLAPAMPRVGEIRIDFTVIVCTMLIVAVVALIFGLIPLVRHSATHPVAAMRGGDVRRATSDRKSGRVRQLLVVSQVMMATILLVASGLVLRSFQNLRAVDPGFRADNVTTFRLALPFLRYRTSDDVARFHYAMLDAIRSMPGVTAAGATGRLPLAGAQDELDIDPLRVDGHVLPPNTLPPLAEMRVATPGYFEAMRIPVVAGRTLNRTDSEQRTGAVVISETVANKMLGGRQPIGARVAHGIARGKDMKPWSDVVGVVGDVYGVSLDKAPTGAVYYSVINKPDTDMDWLARSMAYVVRGSVPPAALIAAVRSELAKRDPSLPLAEVRTLSSIVDKAQRGMRFSTIGFSVAALIGLFMSAIGLYGVLSYVTAQRTREIGVRLALGASPRSVLLVVLRGGIAMSAIGLASGLIAALMLRRLAAPLVYGVAPNDPITLIAVSAVLLLVAAVATLIPALRAARVDPMQALRWE